MNPTPLPVDAKSTNGPQETPALSPEDTTPTEALHDCPPTMGPTESPAPAPTNLDFPERSPSPLSLNARATKPSTRPPCLILRLVNHLLRHCYCYGIESDICIVSVEELDGGVAPIDLSKPFAHTLDRSDAESSTNSFGEFLDGTYVRYWPRDERVVMTCLLAPPLGPLLCGPLMSRRSPRR